MFDVVETPFEPGNWFWIVDGDTSRVWSSAQGAYVSEYPSDRVSKAPNEDELSDVLRRYGLAVPRPNIEDVRSEAQRRIILAVGAQDLNGCLIKQLNANMRANELNDIRHARDLTEREAAEAVALRDLAVKIKAIRQASNLLTVPPIDYRDDAHWPPID